MLKKTIYTFFNDMLYYGLSYNERKEVKREKYIASGNNILRLNVREIVGLSGPPENGGPGHCPLVPLW